MPFNSMCVLHNFQVGAMVSDLLQELNLLVRGVDCVKRTQCCIDLHGAHGGTFSMRDTIR